MSSTIAKPKDQFQEQFEESSANFDSIKPNKENAQQQGRPVQLIRIRPNGKIQINDQALKIIAAMDTPIGFVSLVGKMRTGKSCLLNRLLNLSGKGFKVDPSTQSCTQGIWMWSKPFENKQCNDSIFFLDTEGTDSLTKNVDNDTKIFTLAVLISSYFIYNSLGSIDQRSLSQLEMITALSKNIQTGNEAAPKNDQNQQMHQFMPKFLWLLRDFMLQIEDEKGRKISSTQYLQNCLNDQSGKNEHSKKIKKSILTYFVNRQCLTLVRPVEDEQDLQILNNLPDYGLRRQFIDGINTLRKKIMINTAPKVFQGQTITGYAMASMIQSYVDAFNSGQVPNIRSAWQQINEDEGAVAYAKAIQKYEQIFQQQFQDDEPKGQQLYRILSKLKEETVRQFQEHSYHNKNQQYRQKLQQLIQKKQESIIEGNNNANQIKNIEILQKHAQNLRAKIENNYYMSKDHKQELQIDIDQVVKNYNRDAKGQKKEEIIAEFINYLTPIVLNMESDNTEQLQLQRQNQIKIKEYQAQFKSQQAELESIRMQLQAKNNAAALKQENQIKKAIIERENTSKGKKSGCCAGEKCEIM